jgi:BirA family biotin operon repressor/biotin-[acetyl-CoA-carboxylase] ligase
MELRPDVVVPRLRGSFGREYYYEPETGSTQLLIPDDAGHGAVAATEHQTAGRGRLGRVWIDEPGRGLTFSVLLRPPPPVKRWPELTLVAAGAVAASIGPEVTIKEPNDVLLDGRKVAGILAEAREIARVLVGIGVNVGAAPWPGAGAVDADRLELLLEILERFELDYDAWARKRAVGAWNVRAS